MHECISFLPFLPHDSSWFSLFFSLSFLSLLSFIHVSLFSAFWHPLFLERMWDIQSPKCSLRLSLCVCEREWVCYHVCLRSRPVHEWLTALFDSLRCRSDLLTSAALCFLHLLFCSVNKRLQIAWMSSVIARMSCELQWNAASVPDWQERKVK